MTSTPLPSGTDRIVGAPPATESVSGAHSALGMAADVRRLIESYGISHAGNVRPGTRRVSVMIGMRDPVSLLHPRKLYDMLRACTSADARARAALEFLRGSTGAELGFLLQERGARLALTASTRDQAPPPGLVEEAERAWNELRGAQVDDTKTRDIGEIQATGDQLPSSAWQSANGDSYERRVLGTHRTQWVAVGLVVLKVGAGRALQPIRHAHVVAICEALLDSGDMSVVSPAR